MGIIKSTIWYFLLSLFCLKLPGQNVDSVINPFAHYIHVINRFTQYIPQEKVYLHFDNTSYYQGDNIWFKCYVITTELQLSTELSKTLYVELLNPGGEVIDKRILKLENGQCHGEFTLDRLPFYSGFYEVRAYTKYMLNFGDDVIFSRLLPVFNKPKEEGNFEEKSMLKYGSGKYPIKRGKPRKDKAVNLKFFPEGGNLVQGIESQIAYEATDAYGNPIEITGTIINEAKDEISRFSTIHEGRGVFTHTPTSEKLKAVVNYNDKKYQFDMPAFLLQGFVLKVDNLTYTDSIEVTITKNPNTSVNTLGMVVICGGKLYNFSLINISTDELVRFKIDKTRIPSGVSRIVLFDNSGKIIGDRLVFINKNKLLDIKSEIEKEAYKPYELVNIEFFLVDKEKNPIQTTFSLSVKDGTDEVECGRDILTDLLLMSEIKGFVRNPTYYFETDDSIHRKALDILLMVQGWRRYSWEQMIGTEPFELKYKPEQGIETQGRVVSSMKKTPKPNVEVTFFVSQKDENEKTTQFIDAFVTDSLGQFSFVSNIYGRWDMILATTANGKKKDYRIILDRLFSPEPKKYQYAEMQVTLINTKEEEKDTGEEKKADNLTDDVESFFKAYSDSLVKAGNKEKIHRLEEVTVTAKKRTKEKDIYNSRSKSIAYYDVHSELDDIRDSGQYLGDDIHGFFINLNKNFIPVNTTQGDYLRYKGGMPLFVINYERTMATEMDYNRYKLIRLEAIKSIYINEDLSTIWQYADPRMSIFDVSKMYSCAVFIETYPEGMIPAKEGKGVRRTSLEGYNQIKEFYNPDYSILPQDPDYRRTLYWNPSVTSDKEGKAGVQFYNNSRCRKFKISAETISAEGIIGINKE